MGPKPEVSVIVCTRNRRQSITICLEAIRAAVEAAAPHACEVVIVDSASTDGTAQAIDEWGKKTSFPIKIVRSERPGLARARNVGISQATGDIMIFTDDDCDIAENYIRHAVGTVHANTPALHGGRVLLADTTDLGLTIKLYTNPKRQSKALHSARRSNLGDLLLGCNMIFDRSVLDRVGLFDERLGAGAEIPAGEDTDYIIRCYLAGVELIYDPELVVHHRHGRKTREDGKALFVGYMIGSGALHAKHSFKDVNLLRPIYWDFKNVIGDMIRNKNSFAPEAGFSYIDKFYYYAIGAGRYLFGGRKIPARASGRSARSWLSRG